MTLWSKINNAWKTKCRVHIKQLLETEIFAISMTERRVIREIPNIVVSGNITAS